MEHSIAVVELDSIRIQASVCASCRRQMANVADGLVMVIERLYLG